MSATSTVTPPVAKLAMSATVLCASGVANTAGTALVEIYDVP